MCEAHVTRLKSGVSYKMSRDYRVLIIRAHAIGIKQCVSRVLRGASAIRGIREEEEAWETSGDSGATLR